MTDIALVADHLAHQAKRMTYHIRKPVATSLTLSDFAAIFMTQLQEVENAAHNLIDQRALVLTVSSDCLDKWGDALSRPRPITGLAATDNEAFRALLFAKIAENTSYGTHQDVLNILSTLRALSIIVRDIYPATIEVQYNNSIALLPLADVISILKAATAQIDIDASTFTAKPFGFAGDPTAYGFGVGEIGSTS
jgi:hypothetical protein